MSQINVITLPAFSDNYLWLFHEQNSKKAYVVDPGDAAPVLAALETHGLDLAGILITHHHLDHIGGVDQLLQQHSVPVYGPTGGSVPQVSHPLKQGDVLKLSDSLSFNVYEVPGHTLDHIAYFSPEAASLFCGDTLFAGGCGRLFEGTAEQMHHSLQQLAQLPPNTQVYCAHEYTMANLAFASAVEPNNGALLARIQHDSVRCEQNTPTVPSTIALEIETNPFVRCDVAQVIAAAEHHSGKILDSPVDVLAAVRAWKDSY